MGTSVRWTIHERPTPDSRGALKTALRDVAHTCLGEANQIIPIEEGTLEATGTVQPSGGELATEIAYGTPYARYQHERTDLVHDPGREDHWLEKTVVRNAQRYADWVGAQVRARMGA